MKKAEKIRKMVTRASAGVIFACLLVMTLQINFQGNSGDSPLSLSALSFRLFQPAMALVDECTAGGPGASSCTVTYQADVSIFGVGGGGSVTASVSCRDGYYACCNAGSAGCVSG